MGQIQRGDTRQYFESNVAQVQSENMADIAQASFQGGIQLTQDYNAPKLANYRIDAQNKALELNNQLQIKYQADPKNPQFEADWNQGIGDTSLNKKITAVFGETTDKEFLLQVTNQLYGVQKAQLDAITAWFGDIIGKSIGAQIIAKPNSILKQFIAFANYASGDENVTTTEWFKYAAKAWADIPGMIDYMMKFDWLKDRYMRCGSTDALKKQLDIVGNKFGKVSLLNQPLSWFVRTGDIGAIVFGLKSM